VRTSRPVALQINQPFGSGITEAAVLCRRHCATQLLKHLIDATINAKYLRLSVKSNDLYMIVHVLDFKILLWQVLREDRALFKKRPQVGPSPDIST
jgi:hypothetical protein